MADGAQMAGMVVLEAATVTVVVEVLVEVGAGAVMFADIV